MPDGNESKDRARQGHRVGRGLRSSCRTQRGQRVSLSPAERDVVRASYRSTDGGADPNAVAAFGWDVPGPGVHHCDPGSRDSEDRVDLRADVAVVAADSPGALAVPVISN